MEETKTTNKENILKFFKKHYKKFIAGALAMVILVVSGVLLFQHSAAPRVEDIYDRMVYLIESSHEVNTLIYGCGLPVWEDDSEYVEFMHVYYGLEPAQHYEIVMPNAKYLSINQMKEAIEQIYTNYEEKTFDLQKITGKNQVSFVFLPGCNFDFKWFKFS